MKFTSLVFIAFFFCLNLTSAQSQLFMPNKSFKDVEKGLCDGVCSDCQNLIENNEVANETDINERYDSKLDLPENNVSLLEYGKSGSAESREIILPAIDFRADSNVSYCLSFEAGKLADREKIEFEDARLNISLQNEDGSKNQNNIARFKIENDLRDEGLQCYSATFKSPSEYSSLKIEAKNLNGDSKGVVLNKINISCVIDVLEGINVECINGEYVFTPVFSEGFDVSTLSSYQWWSPHIGPLLGSDGTLILDGNVSNGEIFTIYLKIVDDQGCCDTRLVNVSTQCIDPNGPDLCNAKIRGFAWCDEGGSVPDVFDSNDTPLPFLKYWVFTYENGVWSEVYSSFTNQNGFYNVDGLCAGTYWISFDGHHTWNPVELDQGSPPNVSNKIYGYFPPFNGFTTYAIVLERSQIRRDVGAGFSCSDCSSIIGNVIWCDDNGTINDIYDYADENQSGVEVRLYDASSNLLATTLSSTVTGNYHFSDLCAGEYYVGFTLPDGWTPVLSNEGDDDTIDSDITGTNSIYGGPFIGPISIGDNELALTWDAGFDCGTVPFMKVFPNPAVSNVTTSLDITTEGNYTLFLTDPYGFDKQQIYSGFLEDGKHEFTIDLQNLNSEMYNVVLISNSDITTQKLILKR